MQTNSYIKRAEINAFGIMRLKKIFEDKPKNSVEKKKQSKLKYVGRCEP